MVSQASEYLNLETERELAWAVLNDGCQVSRDRLVKAHAALVVAIAGRYANRGLSFLELIQSGHDGLTRAVDQFDPAQGIRLSTWASWWIKQSIRVAISDRGAAPSADASVPGRRERATTSTDAARQVGPRFATPGANAQPLGRRGYTHPSPMKASLPSAPDVLS